MRKAIGWMMCTALAGCAGTTDKNLSVEAPLYRRENAVEFRVRFIENRAVRAGVVKDFSAALEGEVDGYVERSASRNPY